MADQEREVPMGAGVLDPASLGDRVLVVAPHPDDETLATGGLMAMLAARGAAARIILLTAGDGYLRAARRQGRALVPRPDDYRALGARRVAESADAARALGLSPDAVSCLGFPDGRISAMWERDWERAGAGRAGAAAVPYAFSPAAGTPCCGSALADALADAVRRFSPTAVLLPDTRDEHADHAAAGAFAHWAVERAGSSAQRLAYLVHHGHYPYPWAYRPSDGMRPPERLRDIGARWLTATLDPSAAAAKARALEAFASQNEIPDLRYFMRAFLRAEELFRRDDPVAPGAVVREPRAGLRDGVAPRPRIRTLSVASDAIHVEFDRPAPSGTRLDVSVHRAGPLGATAPHHARTDVSGSNHAMVPLPEGAGTALVRASVTHGGRAPVRTALAVVAD